MSGSFNNRMQKNALRLLKKRGLAVTLRRTAKGAYDSNLGTHGADTVVDYDCCGTVSNMDSTSANQFYSTKSMQDSAIQKEDKMIVLSALLMDGTVLPIIPQTLTDTLIMYEAVTEVLVEYAVIAVVPLAPSAVPILHSVQVRR